MFVVIDGPDGSGKTTLAKQLTDRLNQEGTSAIYTCEPTFSSEAGQKLRDMMRTGEIGDIYQFANLFVEDRKTHIADLIEPTLANGKTVVCDRYKYSALAYQQLQGVDATYLVEINKPCLVPDIIFILTPQSPDILLERIKSRGATRDIFEEIEFLSNTLELYRRLPDYFPDERIVFLDAGASVEDNIAIIQQRMCIS